MKVRALIIGLFAGALLLALGAPAPAQMKRVIKVNLSSWKFEPDILKLNDGDTVVLQLVNVDTQRPHNIASSFFSTINLTVRGDATQGTTSEGWKRVQLEPGKSGEVEFAVKGRGQVSFICAVFDHATRGMTGAFILWPPGYMPGQ